MRKKTHIEEIERERGERETDRCTTARPYCLTHSVRLEVCFLVARNPESSLSSLSLSRGFLNASGTQSASLSRSSERSRRGVLLLFLAKKRRISLIVRSSPAARFQEAVSRYGARPPQRESHNGGGGGFSIALEDRRSRIG